MPIPTDPTERLRDAEIAHRHAWGLRHTAQRENLCLLRVVQGSQPWTVQFEARAKWDAWNEVKGMDAEEAKRQYVALLDKV